MTTELEYALMAGGAYFSTRAPINQFPVPTGWSQLGTSLDNNSGFEAVAFQQGSNIVISYAGTYPGLADITADGLLGAGLWSAQLGEAAAYYLGLRQIYPNANISFTGHSLGGGLASLMAVFFNQPATTFDQAPFALSLGLRNTLIADLENQYGYTAQQLLTLAPTLVDPQTPGNGAANVMDISVAGQLLGSTPPISWFNNIGTQQPPLANGNTGVSATDLHSQALLTLFVMNDQFRQATQKLTDLEKMLFDNKLYAYSTGAGNKKDANILELLIQHQEGIQNVLTPDNMVTRFTSDLWQIAQAGGITMTDQNVSDALIAFAMQSYYEGANATDLTGAKQLFNVVNGGIEFAMTDVTATGTAKGYAQYFQNILTGNKDINFTYLTTAERIAIKAALPAIHDWYVQAGMTGMYATDLNNVNDFMLGGTGNNSLSGGTGNDLLVAGQNGSDTLNGGTGNNTLIAGSGNDFLVGGQGNDTLYGGKGFDTFNYAAPNAGTTTETIIGYATGTGKVEVNGAQLTGGAAVREKNQVWTDSSGDQYQFVASNDNKYMGTLTITQGQLGTTGDQIVIQNFNLYKAQTDPNGYLGIKLIEQLAIKADTSPISPFTSTATLSPTADVPNGNTKTFTIFASAAGGTAQTIQLALAGGNAANLAIDTGASLIRFANGPVNVTIPAGQDYVTLTLVDLTNTNQVDNATLTATMAGANGTVTSNNLAVTFDKPSLGPNQTTSTITGVSVGTTNPYTLYTGDGANDNITTGNGQNSVNGGSGNDVIIGNGGQNVIIAGGGNNQIYANTQVDLATALAAGQQTANATVPGSLIAVGNGSNTIVGGNGNDAIFVGTGNNTIVLGPGSVTLESGVEATSALPTWSVVQAYNASNFSGVAAASAPYTAPPNYNGNYYGPNPVGTGNDTIFGGKGNSTYWLSNGNNWLDAGGGNDRIFAGIGQNTIFGGIGNDTIWGSGGNNFINLESGGDTVILQGGNNTVIGGTGNNSITSGDQGAWASSETGANNYIYGGAGNSVIWGSGGHDTLIGGTGNASIYGGNGSEYIVGGDGNVSIVGGNGSDTIDAGGNGNDTIFAGDGNTTINGGNGSDVITGGAGFDVISAGDGGTTNAPTYVYAGSGISTLYGGAGVDYLVGGQSNTSNDMMVAGTGTSTLQGGSGTETMYSSIGNATLIAGTGSDTLYGGGGTDVLQGSSGNTLFVAGSGNETIRGGSGSNTYEFDAGFGNVELGNTQSADTFRFGAGISLADLTVSATIGSDGSSALLIQTSGGGQLTIDNGLNGAISQFAFANNNTTLTLNQLLALANTTPATVAGANGNLLFSASSNSTLAGGTGYDTIYGWNGGNTLIAGSGNQTLYSKSGLDTLTAGTGNDILVSAAGHDSMIGGTGNTTFVVNSATDVIQALSTGSNTNTLMSSVDYVAPANVQNLTGTGIANLSLTGNNLNNVITANSGNDTLIAGTGMATLNGGSGNNTFVVNNSADVIQAQSTGSNVNTVLTSVDYVTPANVQNITGTGSAAITLTGNGLNDVITANSGNDTLIAGSGTAILNGGSGSGNDTFVVNNAADVVQAQSTGSNVNTVLTSVDYVTPANVQTLTGTGSADITLTGNSLNDVITANSGNDTLDGGAGNSTLYGGAGLDTFVMGYGMGTDTAIDTALQGGIVQLRPGLSLSDLSATQQGNDLLLWINGSTTESMRIQGYYTHPQTAWTIKDGSGVSVSPQSTLDATAARQAVSGLAQMESDFIAHAKGELTSSLLASGYLMQADGTFYQPYQMPQIGRIVTTQAGQETQIDKYANGTVASSWTRGFSRTSITAYPYNWYNRNYVINFSDGNASINVVDTASNASVVYADSYLTGSQNHYTRWLQMNWTSTPTTSSPYNSSTTIPYGYYKYIPIKQPDGSFAYLSQGPFWGTETTSDVGVTTQTAIAGTVSGVLSDPGNLVATGTTPQILQAQYDHVQTAYEIQKINLGTGGQTVYANAQSLVISNSGNDTINDAGFVYTGVGNDMVASAGTVYCGTGNNEIDNAVTAYGGTGNDTMIGGGTQMAGSGNDLLEYGNTMIAGSGSDTLIGGGTMVAGSGSDQMFAGPGKATFRIDPVSAGTDILGGAGNSWSFLNAFYQSMGITDWRARYVNVSPGMYRANIMIRTPLLGIYDAQEIMSLLHGLMNLLRGPYTLQNLIDNGWVTPLDPLPVLVKVNDGSLPLTLSPYYATANVPMVTLSANDYQTLAPYYAQGILPTHEVVLDKGVLPSDLRLSWGQTVGSITGLSTDPQLRYTTLDLSWGINNQSIQVMIPHSTDPLGSGIQEFVFADGTRMNMAQMIALAPPAPTFDPQLIQNFIFQPNMGAQTLPSGVSTIQFDAGMIPTSVSVTQNSLGNFVISYNNGASTLVVPAQSAVSSPVVANFANGTSWQFVNAAGNPYTYNAGSGVVYLINAAGSGTVQFGTGITSGMITLGLGSLMLRVGSNGDTLHIEGFNPADALNSGEIQTFKFADGTTLSYSQLLARGFDIYGTTGNETLTGTNLDNRIHAGTGNDVLIGSGAHDTLYGGVGNDTLMAGSGTDLLIAGAGLTTMTGGTGNDTFVINNANDVIQAQSTGSNTNTVLTSVSYVAPANVQNLTGTGAADLTLTGNTLNNVITADSGNDTLTAGSGIATLIGGTGNDIFVVNNVNDVVQAQSTGSNINTVLTSVSYVAPANVQNLTGTGTADLTLTGNSLDNTLTANSGNDTLVAGSGVATMIGGTGNDTFVVNNVNDVVQAQFNGSNINTVLSSVSYVAPANVQNLTGTGSADLTLTGNNLNNVITANSGNDTLIAGAGVATMIGGTGSDTFVVNNVNDLVQAQSTGGNLNTVLTSVNYVAPANVQNLTGTGSANLTLTGNALDNVITANSGNDTLIAGTGLATMVGGAGNDTFVVNNSADVVQAQANAGINTVVSSVSYSLATNAQNAQNLTLTGTADLTGEGNTLDNVITANSGNDTLIAGAGIATLVGGAGNDTFVINNANDVIQAQSTGSNINTVQTSVSYTAPANVQNLTGTGAADLSLTGNNLDNVITANSGNDTLIAGSGVATLIGGVGNDTFVINNANDVIQAQSTGSNINTVQTSVSYTAPANVQNITGAGTANLSLTGNNLDNVITANSGNDTLIGAGGNDTFVAGAGNDMMIGGAGNDTYVYNQGNGLDTLVDTGGNNTIRLGAGLSYQNVIVRLTYADGTPYTVYADGEGDHHGEGDQNNSANLIAHMMVLDSNGVEQVGQGMNFAVTVDNHGNITSPIQTFQFNDGSTQTFDAMLVKTDTLDAEDIRGPVITGRNDTLVHAGRHNTGIWLGTGNDTVRASEAGSLVYAGGGNDYLVGSGGNDTFIGGWGVDILQGGEGNDILTDLHGRGALLGGKGNDTITSGTGNPSTGSGQAGNFIAAGRGNDIISTGASHNVIAFNKNDGRDTILASPGASNTLSLGGEINYRDLSFSKNGNDLVLNEGRESSVTFKGWYAGTANQDFATLQIIGQQSGEEGRSRSKNDASFGGKVNEFDFAKLVAMFDQASADKPSLNKWSLMDGLLSAHLSSSDTAALGGDLAYVYGTHGSLSGMSVSAAQSALQNAQFGTAPQTLNPWPTLNTGTAHIR